MIVVITVTLLPYLIPSSSSQSVVLESSISSPCARVCTYLLVTGNVVLTGREEVDGVDEKKKEYYCNETETICSARPHCGTVNVYVFPYCTLREHCLWHSRVYDASVLRRMVMIMWTPVRNVNIKYMYIHNSIRVIRTRKNTRRTGRKWWNRG